MANRFEIQLQALEKKMQDRVDEYKAIYKKADDERRNLDEQEQATVLEAHRALETLKDERELVKAQLDELKAVDELGKSLGPAISSVEVKSEPQDRIFKAVNDTLGDRFVSSEGYKSVVNEYKSTGRLREGFSTGSVMLEAKGTLLEGSGSPGSGTGGGLLVTPQEVPGVVDTLFQPLTFSNLILSGQASGNTVRYVVEGTATSGAAGVAEGGTKPESTVALSTRDEPIKKIATILPISEEMLEDAPQVRSYINGRLTLFVRIEEERQLIRGTSGGAEVQGLLTSRNVPVYAGGTAAGSKAEQLFKAMNGMRGSAFVEPEWIVMNPSDWQDIRLAKDTAQQYFGGGPFFGPYGGPQGPASATGQIQGPTDQVWGKQVYVTGAVGAGTAIVGSRAAAQVWRRGGLSVEASNSHSNYFQLNLVAIRAEERLGLAVYRPGGFVEVRLS